MKSVKETPEETEARVDLELRCAEMGKMIGDCLPPGLGFVLLLFDFGERGNLAYLSNAEREGVVRAMKEFIDRNPRS